MHIRKYTFGQRTIGESVCGLLEVEIGDAEEGACNECIVALSESTQRWLAGRLFGRWLALVMGLA